MRGKVALQKKFKNINLINFYQSSQGDSVPKLAILLVTMISVYYNIHSFKNSLQNRIYQV
jgi:hypothetical protein